jgi:hypothetical protein
MLYQQVTLSGDAEWPKVADAVIEALFLKAFAMYAAFPRSDYYAQFDCLLGLGVSYEFPHSYSPPSLTSLPGSPVFTA